MNNKETAEHLTIDALHQFAYCPRRMHLMYNEGLWAGNAFTEDGRFVHRRVDDRVDPLPESADAGDAPPAIVRSVQLGSDALGLTGKLDLLELDGPTATPVESKRGHVPDNPERSWEPERVQLMAQGLLLREHGFTSDHGVLYFTGSRVRVNIEFTQELEARTWHLLAQTRLASLATVAPPPLDHSPKCNGCSLAGICLPDEIRALADAAGTPADVRRLYPARDDAVPLYVQDQGASVGKNGEGLHVTKGGQTLAECRLLDVSQVVLCGNISISAQALHLLCEQGVPVLHLSLGHWFYGITAGFGLRNAYDRAAQFAAAADPERCLRLAREFVRAKVANQRTLLRRNSDPQPDGVLNALAREGERVQQASDMETLLGMEGAAARLFFGAFSGMLRPTSLLPETEDVFRGFDFNGRNRRPPRDPVNAMLSFGYAMLVKDATVALAAAGLDPYWGFFHQPRHGRPALALDLMEEFRSLIVDSAVITAINTGRVAPEDFVTGASACAVTPAGRKAFIKVYEARMDQLATHPVFDYRCSWRALLGMQARLLARVLRGELRHYQGITTR